MAKTTLFATSIASALIVAASAPLLISAVPDAENTPAIAEEETASIAGISTQGLNKREIKRLERMLDGREAGEARQCISLRKVRRSTGLGDDILIYEMRGGNILVNRPRSGCNNLGGNGIINSTPDDRICEGQIFEVRDFRAGISLGGCSFGEFVEYTKTEAEAEDSAD